MLILVLRTDNPDAEIGLYQDGEKVAYEIWRAHRQLAETLHTKIKNMLDAVHKDWADIQGIIAYEGPGSFTGLRIGLSVANALAGSLSIPVIGSTGEAWISEGVARLNDKKGGQRVLPFYGAEVHTTPARK